MSIPDNGFANSRKHYDKNGNEVAQRMKATRIMGLIGGTLFAGFLFMIRYSIIEKSKAIGVCGIVVSIQAMVDKSNRSSIG